MASPEECRANVLFLFDAKAAKRISPDTARATIRSALEEAIGAIDDWFLVGTIDFMGFEVSEQSRHRKIKVTVGVPVLGPGYEDEQNLDMALAQTIAYGAMKYLVEEMSNDDLWVNEIRLVWAAVLGDEPREVQLYQPERAPVEPRHLRSI